jgi:ABC-type lipopolysaccharide export system ATPase subunit
MFMVVTSGTIINVVGFLGPNGVGKPKSCRG